MQLTNTGLLNSGKNLFNWFFNIKPVHTDNVDTSIDYFRVLLIVVFHLACLAVFYVGISVTAILLAVFLYLSRMFFITGFYHRYFSHRTYKASRLFQFVMAIAGCTAGQRGPLWWASHHRHHHMSADTELDPHSPRHGFINSHMLWFLRKNNFYLKEERIKDWLKYPELRMLEHFDWLPFLLLAFACYGLGEFLYAFVPSLQTNGLQLLVWGFFISTVVLYHATYTINSLAHRYGKRRYETKDDSRNNFFLALLTLGEGWHNNHHRYPNATRQGFFWWELDISYFMIVLLSHLGLIHSIQAVPASVLQEARKV